MALNCSKQLKIISSLFTMKHKFPHGAGFKCCGRILNLFTFTFVDQLPHPLY